MPWVPVDDWAAYDDGVDDPTRDLDDDDRDLEPYRCAYDCGHLPNDPRCTADVRRDDDGEDPY